MWLETSSDIKWRQNLPDTLRDMSDEGSTTVAFGSSLSLSSSVDLGRGVRRGGGSGEPPFFQINYIHSMAWHANSYCYPRYLFKVQIFIKIPTEYTETEINIGRIEFAVSVMIILSGCGLGVVTK